MQVITPRFLIQIPALLFIIELTVIVCIRYIATYTKQTKTLIDLIIFKKYVNKRY